MMFRCTSLSIITYRTVVFVLLFSFFVVWCTALLYCQLNHALHKYGLVAVKRYATFHVAIDKYTFSLTNCPLTFVKRLGDGSLIIYQVSVQLHIYNISTSASVGTFARAHMHTCGCAPPMTRVICIATCSLNTHYKAGHY